MGLFDPTAALGTLAMLRFAVLSIAASLLFPAPAVALDVYIVAGQSNGWRISSLAEAKGAKPDEHKVYYYGMHCVSEPVKSEFKVLKNLNPKRMGYGLADALRKLSDDDIIFIQYCRCGAGVWNKGEKGWYPGDDPPEGKVFNDGLYGKFLKYLAHARKSAEQDHGLKWNVRGLFWHQGESDSGYQPEGYEERLSNLLWRFRRDLGKDLPIVAAHIRELNDGDRTINATLSRMAEKDPHLAVVESNDLQFEPDHKGKPNVHFALEGCLELGRRMARAFADVVGKQSR